jgi:hypothetical protein
VPFQQQPFMDTEAAAVADHFVPGKAQPSVPASPTQGSGAVIAGTVGPI